MMMTGAGILLAAVSIVNAGLKTDVGYISETAQYASGGFCRYPDMSAVTWIDGNRFYAVRNTANSCMLYRMTPTLAGDGTMTTAPTMEEVAVLQGVYDAEGIARDPCRGTVWVTDEMGAKILEYDPTTGWPTYRVAPVPAVIVNNLASSNLSLESLTISGDGLTMWTANEEALTCDGAQATSSAGTVVRLVKFTRPDVQGGWTLAGMWAYLTDPIGSDTPQQCGVADLAALPDGSLLVLEREASVGTTGRARIYRLPASAFASATDISGIPSLKGASYTRVNKGSALYEQCDGLELPGRNFDYDIACYEGLCLGPRNGDGSVNLMMISDGGAYKTRTESLFIFEATAEAWTRAYVRALKMTGLDNDIVTVSFAEPAAGNSTIVGSNYRYQKGDTVSLSLTGLTGDLPYVLNGTARSACSGWTFAGAAPASGTGATASFEVGSDGVFSWAAKSEPAVTGYHVVDSFEGFEDGAPVSSVSGWTGEEDCCVRTLTYAPPATGYVMGQETHTRVLDSDDVSTRALPPSATGDCRIDVMVNMRHSKQAFEPCDDDIQLELRCDASGRLCLWHLYEEAGAWKRGWTTLSDVVYPDDTWVRVELEFDSTSNPDHDAFVRVKVNGSCQTTARGVRAPDRPVAYGAWHYLAKNRRTGGVTAPREISFLGTKVDDLMLSTRDVAAEDSGPSKVEGIDVEWFDQSGLPRDPSAPAPFLEGYTLGMMHDAGLDPYSNRPLEITGIEIGDDTVTINLNGYRGDKPVGYRVLHSMTLDFKSPTVILPSDGTFIGNPVDGTTVWKGSVPHDASGNKPVGGFFRIEGLR